jgi:hypothetical protein
LCCVNKRQPQRLEAIVKIIIKPRSPARARDATIRIQKVKVKTNAKEKK